MKLYAILNEYKLSFIINEYKQVTYEKIAYEICVVNLINFKKHFFW